jgi:hypothetical protein
MEAFLRLMHTLLTETLTRLSPTTAPADVNGFSRKLVSAGEFISAYVNLTGDAVDNDSQHLTALEELITGMRSECLAAPV